MYFAGGTELYCYGSRLHTMPRARKKRVAVTTNVDGGRTFPVIASRKLDCSGTCLPIGILVSEMKVSEIT